jgi:hypothetical protein
MKPNMFTLAIFLTPAMIAFSQAPGAPGAPGGGRGRGGGPQIQAVEVHSDHTVSVAPKNGAVMAGRKGPAMWLRYGPLPAHRRQI